MKIEKVLPWEEPRLFYWSIAFSVKWVWEPLKWCHTQFHFWFGKNEKGMYLFCHCCIKDGLSKLSLELSGNYFTADFELTLRSAIENTFPNIEMKGWNFHFAPCIWKFVIDNDHNTNFSTSSELAKFIKCAIGMAFVHLVPFQDGLDMFYD